MERSWAILGRSRVVLGRSCGDLGRSWGGLGWSWSHLGSLLSHLGRAWGHLEAVSSRLGEPKTLIFLRFFNVFLQNRSFQQKWSSWLVLRRSWSLLGRSWCLLGRSWGSQEAARGGARVQQTFNKRSRSAQAERFGTPPSLSY